MLTYQPARVPQRAVDKQQPLRAARGRTGMARQFHKSLPKQTRLTAAQLDLSVAAFLCVDISAHSL